MRDLFVTGTTASGLSRIGYLDIAEQLSRANRKLFSQEMVYGVEDVRFGFQASPAYDTVTVTLSTAGDTWSVHNGYVKARALWHEMNDLVLKDNPSVAGQWADYKVFMDNTHRIIRNAGDKMQVITSEGIPTLPGAWDYSEYVVPQHDVDAAGVPLPADQTFVHLLGADSGAIGAWNSIGIVNAYQESRATVQDDSPNVPVGFKDSFFNLLTDSGSQEPELADLIVADNDSPPYDLLNYPGGDLNSVDAWVSAFGTANGSVPTATTPGFLAQCGLVKILVNATLNGEAVNPPAINLLFSIAPGMYKGVAAIPMGQ